jgi:hypothetical protein
MSEREPSIERRILWLRRMQVRMVAAGTFGAVVLLAGAVIGSLWALVAGALIFSVALIAIFGFGAAAIWSAATSRRFLSQKAQESKPAPHPTRFENQSGNQFPHSK